MLGTISQVMATESVVERVDKLEKKFDELEATITNQISQLETLIETSHREEPSVDSHIEGESNHHIKFHGNHHSSSQ